MRQLKYVFLISLISFWQNHASAEKGGLTLKCNTEKPVKISISVKTLGDVVKMDIDLGEDRKQLPIYNGLVTASDFDSLKKNADFLSALPNKITMSWGRKNCKKFAPEVFECSDLAPSAKASFYTSKILVSTGGSEKQWREVNVIFFKDGAAHPLQANFPEGSCLFN